MAPQQLALLGHRGAHAVEAVPTASVALNGVLDVQVLRALAAHPRAELGQVALVLRLAANGGDGPELKSHPALECSLK